MAAADNPFDFPEELARYESARVAVLPCPYDGTSTWAKGADQGPRALLATCNQLEYFDVELERSPGAVGIHVLPAVSFPDQDPEQAVRRIEAAARRPLADGKFLVGIGGEHTVTVGLTRALRAARGPFSVLQIDAHHDLRASYEGSPYNHACVMHRVAEDDRQAALVAIAIRACSQQEFDYARSRGILTFYGHQLPQEPRWIERAVAHLRDPVYVTVDLDGLDPSVMPSTGTPVPGGIGWHDTLALLRRVSQERRVIGCDLNELKPDPVNHHSQFLAAQLLYKMIGYFVR